MNNHIGINIDTLRAKKNLSQTDLAEIAGVTQQTVSAWENGTSTPRRKAIVKIIEAFPELTYDSIMSDENGYYKSLIKEAERKGKANAEVAIKKILDEVKQEFSCKTFVDVPLYGSIAAGKPIEMIEVDETHPVPAKVMNKYPDAFLLKVKGRSMDKVLPDGCYALIDPCEEVERENQPHAVCVNGYDATIKRVRNLANGIELDPDSTDPTFKPSVYDYADENTEEITIIGRVVYYVLPFDWGF